MKDLFEKFKNPDRRYAIYQIIHGRTENLSLVDDYDKRWFGGVVGNINYDRAFPDNEQGWKKVETAMREYIKRGMKTWIYDEKGYPSGSAGGYVTETHPEFIAKGLYCFDYWRQIVGPMEYRADVPGDELWKAVLIPVNGGDPFDVTECLNENNVLYIDVPEGNYYLFMMSKRRLFDGTHASESFSEPRNYISLSDKKATGEFIRCTHENYKKYIGDEFGKGVLAMFTDEPSLISWNIRTGVFPILPWHESYPADFEARYGYDFMLACVAVVLRMGNNVVKRRCDFWEFIADTVAEGFFKTIQDWCHQNNLKSSGHMLEEDNLQAHVFNYGSFSRSMKYMDWPGIDNLETEPEELMRFDKLPFARFVASFADISGEGEVFTEYSDVSPRIKGKEFGVKHYYYSTNWHLAMGINNFTTYYTWKNVMDEEAYDLNHYVARAGYMLRQGVRDSKVAVFYPEASMWAGYTPSIAKYAIDHSKDIQTLEKAFTVSSWDFIRSHVEVDFIDAQIISDGEIKDGKLCYNERKYEAVTVPCAYVLEDRVAEKLIALADAGVKIFFCEKIPEISRETGEKLRLADTVRKYVENGKMYFSEIDGFAGLIENNLPESCRPVKLSGDATMVLSHCRKTSDGKKIVFVTNMAYDVYKGILTDTEGYGKAYVAVPSCGEIKVTDMMSNSIEIELQPGEGVFYIFE